MSWVITALLLLCLGGSHLEWGTLQIAAGQGRGRPNPPGQSGSGQGRGRSDPPGRAARARQTVDAEVARQGRRTRARGGPRRPFRAVSSFLGSSDTTRRIGMSFRLQQETVNLERDFQRIGPGRVDLTAVFTALRGILRPNETAEESDVDVMPGTDIGVCPFPRIRCNRKRDTEFRTLTGACNNLQRPLQGRSNTPFIRRLAPDYSDGFNAPRTGKNGALPSPRDVSVKLFENVAKRSGIHTHLIMSIGQFLDHDLTRTAISTFTGQGGEALEFECGPDGCDTNGAENRPCFPIEVTKPDRAFNDRRCLMFVRTQGVPALDCKTGPRQQLNQLTGYIDASNIYGSTGSDARGLREGSGGRLKVLLSAKPLSCNPLLPRDRNIIDCDEQPRCFNAGDKRVNENAALSVIHTVFVREHNLIADKLADIHDNWNDQRLYQETRKLIGAIWQHIVYNEYLPAVLGSNRNRALKLRRGTRFGQAYQKGVDASIVSGFATAAFRFPHSQIGAHLKFASNTFSSTESVKISEVLRRPGEVFNNNRAGGCGVSSIAFGLLQQKAMVVDRFIPDQITDKLFSPNPPDAAGTDLMSLNLQRGRDHGIPGYNEWRVEAKLPRARSFRNLGNIPNRAKILLRGIYNHVDDIDLFAGGMSERPDGNGLLGKTFKEIVSEQFVRLRVGDRFFYDNNNKKKTINFNKYQIREIRKMSIARILCDTLDDVETIQPFALLLPLSDALRGNAAAAYSVGGLYRGEDNERVNCTSIGNMNFTLF